MATDARPSTPFSDADLSRVHSAVIREQDAEISSPNAERAVEKDTVQLVLSLPREEAERLAARFRQGNDPSASTANNISAPSPSQEAVPATPSGPTTRARTTSRTVSSDAQDALDAVGDHQQGSSSSASRSARAPNAHINGSPAPMPQDPSLPPAASSTPIEMQGFLDTERSYTNAFHKTLSLFVDDKTFSTPSLRGAVVGFLESCNATVLETLPHHGGVVPEHLRQEIDNHVNLVKTVLQRGGVFAEDYLRARLKKLSAHIPRIEAAMNGGRGKSSSKPPQLLPQYGDPYAQRELSPSTAAANEAALAQAAEAAARSNSRHHEMIAAGIPPTPPNGEEMMVDMNFGPNGPPMPPPPPLPGMPMHAMGPGPMAIPPQVGPPVRPNKTFLPPSLVPSQVMPGPGPEVLGGGSPPPVLAPFDPRPNPMACLFCRQRKIRCIGHKPNPCEICVKRGFICSYDWISRRGKRKPKNQDGSPAEMPPGSVAAAPLGTQSRTDAPAMPPQPAGPPPPPVGLHGPGMHSMHLPGMPPGPPADGQFSSFHYGPPGLSQMPQHPPPVPSRSPSAPSGGSPAAPSSSHNMNSEDEAAMMIDPSLIGNGHGASNGHSKSSVCNFCKEQALECDGSDPCANCSRRQLACVHEKTGRSKKSRGENGTPKKKKRGGDTSTDAVAVNKKQKVAADTAASEGQSSADGDAEMTPAESN